jgi:hypothetical protein
VLPFAHLIERMMSDFGFSDADTIISKLAGTVGNQPDVRHLIGVAGEVVPRIS